MNSNPSVLIVGGGLAGLCCALRLQDAGVRCQILEASHTVGGRVKTETYQGFLLDHGFQVLLTAYPEAKRVLNYEELQLKSFTPGALIRFRGRFHSWVDPWRRPQHAWKTLISPIGSISDKLRIALLSQRLKSLSLEQIHSRPEVDTLSYLYQNGFSEKIIRRFFKPFLGGVFLESELKTTSRKFEFVFRMFGEGDAAIPAKGMGEITQQLTDRLPPGTIRLNCPVQQIANSTTVELVSGEQVHGSTIVLACDLKTTAKLLNVEPKRNSENAVHCFYYGVDKPPIDDPILILNGDGTGPINNLAVPSLLSPDIAPPDKHLVSVSVISDSADSSESKGGIKDLETRVRRQLLDWFGEEVNGWKFLKQFHIANALPTQQPGENYSQLLEQSKKYELHLCGDYLQLASIQSAMVSGRETAEGIIKNMRS